MFNLRLLTLAPVLYCAVIGCELQHPLFYELDQDHPSWITQDVAVGSDGVSDAVSEDRRLGLHPPDVDGPDGGDAVVLAEDQALSAGDVAAVDTHGGGDVWDEDALSVMDAPLARDDMPPEVGMQDTLVGDATGDASLDVARDVTADAVVDALSDVTTDSTGVGDSPVSACPSSCAYDSQCQVPGCSRHTCSLHTCQTSIPLCPVFCSTDSQCAVDACPFRHCVLGECAM